MLKHLRQEKILDYVRKEKSIEVTSLCSLFKVTDMTVRRDLEELASKGLLMRTHGGAVSTEHSQIYEKPFDVRLISHLEQKKAIAREALKLMTPGGKFFMNSSSTVFCMAQALDNDQSYLIASEATNIANELITRQNVSVIQIGGELRKNTLSCVGYYAEELIRRFRFDTAFIGINGMDKKGDLYCGSMQETGIYRAIFDSSDSIYVLADSSRLGRTDFAHIGNMRQLTGLITDRGITPELKETYRDAGLKIIIA